MPVDATSLLSCDSQSLQVLPGVSQEAELPLGENRRSLRLGPPHPNAVNLRAGCRLVILARLGYRHILLGVCDTFIHLSLACCQEMSHRILASDCCSTTSLPFCVATVPWPERQLPLGRMCPPVSLRPHHSLTHCGTEGCLPLAVALLFLKQNCKEVFPIPGRYQN